MNENKPYFFCGIGGSGMLPLALIMQSLGFTIIGSDRSRDQGRTPEKFAFIEAQGIKLYPQDGSGVTPDVGFLVISSAVEDSVPDYKAAKDAGIPVALRAELLTRFFNLAPTRIAVAGTSGKSTTTGMIGWILHQAGQHPTVINGAVMKNFMRTDFPLASAVVGTKDLFVCEADESDGSIALWSPTIAVLNNISYDHKPLEELRQLFGDFVSKAGIAVLNLDNAETAALVNRLPAGERPVTYSLNDNTADYYAHSITHTAMGVVFLVDHKGATTTVRLMVPGEHNISNALAAIAATAGSVSVTDAAEHLATFTGMKRRLEVIGTENGITVIDDFAQNPDKINASMRALHVHAGRLLVIFQPHGYVVINRDCPQFVEGFTQALRPDDVLYVTDPLYMGGTTTMTNRTSDVMTGPIAANGRHAVHKATRDECLVEALKIVQPGDRIVVMGARDDSLHTFAHAILETLRQQSAALPKALP